MIAVSANVGDVRYTVVPQSPQKYEVISAPLRAVSLRVLGVPLTSKPSCGTMMLMLYKEPEIF